MDNSEFDYNTLFDLAEKRDKEFDVSSVKNVILSFKDEEDEETKSSKSDNEWKLENDEKGTKSVNIGLWAGDEIERLQLF